jgi:hypothetical protein
MTTLKWQHTIINQELTAEVEGLLERRSRQGKACGEGRCPIIWGDNWSDKKNNVKYIVVLDGCQSMLYHNNQPKIGGNDRAE